MSRIGSFARAVMRRSLQAVTSPFSRLTSERIVALSAAITGLSTVILAVVTWCYVDLTRRLVLLGVEPSIEVGLDPRAWEAPNTLVVHNAGAVPVVEVIVNMRCFLFRDDKDRNPMIFFQGLPWDRKSSWWQIGTLRPADVVRKDATDTASLCLRNKESQEKFENERTKAEAKSQGVRPIRLASLAIFDLCTNER